MSTPCDWSDIDTDACQAEIEAELGDLIAASNRVHRGWQALWEEVAVPAPAWQREMRRLA